uniref:BPTI/Kunitz inhibitor domain-containing protein n=1 Tax=Steinernema glaseri TaxID=37863 RepID=A0A1I7YRE8_9BILA
MWILDLALLQIVLGTVAGDQDSGSSAAIDSRSPCQKPFAVGTCSGKIPRYYYNAELDRCFKFHYSGCEGNSNRFISRKHCVKRCSQRRLKKIRLKDKAQNKTPKALKVRPFPRLPKAEVTVVAEKAEDECASCHRTHAKCVNGSCQCLPGFLGNGQQCLDIDECAQDPGLCHEKAYCMNTEGSYYCECQLGYAGSGTNCTLHADICTQAFDKRYLEQCDKRGHWEIRFYFDSAARLCRRFWYGGCAYQDNQNIFADAQVGYGVDVRRFDVVSIDEI